MITRGDRSGIRDGSFTLIGLDDVEMPTDGRKHLGTLHNVAHPGTERLRVKDLWPAEKPTYDKDESEDSQTPQNVSPDLSVRPATAHFICLPILSIAVQVAALIALFA